MSTHGPSHAARAAANAALEGIVLADDEGDLVQARRDGKLTHDEFLLSVRKLALRKTGDAP